MKMLHIMKSKNAKIQDFWQNMHFLANEKWQFWRQNPLEPSYGSVTSTLFTAIMKLIIYNLHSVKIKKEQLKK